MEAHGPTRTAIVDTHVHYSEPERPERPYDPEFIEHEPALEVEALLIEAERAGVDKVVEVTQAKMGYDNRYALESCVKHSDRVLGVVGSFDPLAPEIGARLKRFIAQPRMLGIRFALVTPKTKSWLRDRILDPFLNEAQELGVHVQLSAAYQFEEIRETARRFPGIRFLLIHMGLHNSQIRPISEVFSRWPELMKLAEEPNIWIKVSYFPEAAQGSERYPFPMAQRRFRELYEQVGAGRLVWASNFPRVAAVCTYRESLDFVRQHCDFLNGSEKAAILGQNFLTYFMPNSLA